LGNTGKAAKTSRIQWSSFFILVLVLGLIIYFGLLPPLVYSPVTRTTSVIEHPNKWMEVVDLISGCQRIAVESFSTGQRTLIARDDNLSGQIFSFLQASSVRKVTSKVSVIDGETQTALVAYKYDLFLYFELGNGSSVKLDLVGNTIWYEDEFSAYEVDINPNMFGLVDEFLLAHSNLPSEIKLYQQGLELSVTLSSLNIRTGEDLTINATLQNVNNTSGITFADSKDNISLNVYNSSSLVVYSTFMVMYGQNTYSSLELGQKISIIFKWDTSQNVSNGNKPPFPGKYVIQISASVKDLDSGSKITLKTDYIEITLS